MKIRWSHDSIRLRITPGDLEAIAAGKPLDETLDISGSPAWKMSVLPGSSETRIEASADLGVQIRLSTADRAKLSRNDTEGVYLKEGELRYYIEKDFPCEHPRPAETMEPSTETFARP